MEARYCELERQKLNTPKFHFAPARNWMNDPNGLTFLNGEYHLFYQYNPYDDVWGHMSWGHAISTDLVHWRELGVAIPETNVMAFSGSAVVDSMNTSGLGSSGKPPIVAIYTGADPRAHRQAQRLAYSVDEGRTWSLLSAPVLDLGLPEFRDPKIFWHPQTQRWVMAVAHASEHKIEIYSSTDLLHWTAESKFGPAGAVGGAWECPDLFPLSSDSSPADTRWVMPTSLNQSSGHSETQYFVGRFDGSRFELDASWDGATHWLDDGADFYAAQSWSDIPVSDGRRLIIGWAANWRYAAAMPTYPSRGTMSMPRALSLVRTAAGYVVQQRPIVEFLSLRHARQFASDIAIGPHPVDLGPFGLRGGGLEFEVDLDMGAAQTVLFSLTDASGYQTVLGISAAAHQIFINRTRSGPHFHDAFPSSEAVHTELAGGKVHLHVFVDQSVLELFIDNGAHTMTERFFPGDAALHWTVQAIGGHASLVHLTSWRLH